MRVADLISMLESVDQDADACVYMDEGGNWCSIEGLVFVPRPEAAPDGGSDHPDIILIGNVL